MGIGEVTTNEEFFNSPKISVFGVVVTTRDTQGLHLMLCVFFFFTILLMAFGLFVCFFFLFKGILHDEPYYYLSEILSHDSFYAGECLKKVLDKYKEKTDVFLWMDNVGLLFYIGNH